MNIKYGEKIRDIVLTAMMSAILFGVQVALAFLPNIELVSLLVIIFSHVFGYKVFIMIYIFAVAEGLTYGFGTWWVCYLYVWTILAAAALFLRRIQSPYIWAFISGLYGLLFGFLCAVTYLFIGGPQMMFSYWIAGIMFDVTHCAGNFFVALVLYKPVKSVLLKLYKHPVKKGS